MNIQTKLGPRWLPATTSAIVAHAILISCAVAWVAIYSHLIAPGLPISAYQAHAKSSGPWVSLVVGVPLFFWLGQRLARPDTRRAIASAMACAGAYIVSDAMILMAIAGAPLPWLAIITSYTSKLGAAWFGGWLAVTRKPHV